MHRILYISSARAPLSDLEIERVLTTSRRNNRRADITGLLVVGGRRFLQVLEGPEDAVRTTFARISEDTRHYAIVELSNSVITDRSFSRWAMGFQKGGGVEEGVSLEEQVAIILEPVIDPNLRAYFSGFARSHDKAA